MPAPKAMVAAKYREVKTHRNMIDVQFPVCEDKAVVNEADGVMNLLAAESHVPKAARRCGGPSAARTAVAKHARETYEMC